MTAKGYVTGNDPADRLLEALNGKPREPKWSQEQAAQLVEWKHAIRGAIPKVLAAERNRTIASLRGRLRFVPDEACCRAILSMLDQMELSA